MPAMKNLQRSAVRFAALALTLGSALSLGAKAQEAPVATAAQVPLPAAVRLGARPPMGATVLFTGKAEEITENWYKRYSKTPATWTVSEENGMTPVKSDITSKKEFGDCFVHVEFNCPTGHGNAGVGLMGRYEVQIYNTFGEALTNQNGGAFYSQKAGKYNAAKKAGEWQSYDILFRAPRFGPDGKVTEPARASVFWNGVLVQNNEAFNGPTGIQYSEYKTEAPTGPIILQGDHDVVRYRNVWVVSL